MEHCNCTIVHPHGCGEYSICSGVALISPGSSPRVWGILLEYGPGKCSSRFIPTGVGNTNLYDPTILMPAVHPHGCGEYDQGAGARWQLSGSSPRVWGILGMASLGNLILRFIPTGVGNTSRAARHKNQTPVHPHGCGEYFISTGLSFESQGSSPRVWGIQQHYNGAVSSSRFIPTGVGNTTALQRSCVVKQVHPHGCGEYEKNSSQESFSHGSSPRVWGIRTQFALKTLRRGFIPTGVGNTATQYSDDLFVRVHPHGCGEYQSFDFNEMPDDGSSPRVWGIRNSGSSRSKILRFIPTGVGNTNKFLATPDEMKVHPHGCGEYLQCSFFPTRAPGSSPRVWGIHNHGI